MVSVFQILASAVPLSAMAVEDWKYRSFHIGWLLFYAMIVVSGGFPNGIVGIINLMYLTVLLGVCFVYLKLRNRPGNLLTDYFGLGDTMLLVVLTPTLDSQTFLAVILAGSIIGILMMVMARMLSYNMRSIPFVSAIGPPILVAQLWELYIL